MVTRTFGSTGVAVPVIGQGTWRMGEVRAEEREEVAALRLGIELGLTHIDTAELYGDGGAERVVAQAIAGARQEVFVATKVHPANASYEGTLKACEQSLRRLRRDHVGYTPLARGGFMRGVVAEIAKKHSRTPRQVALNFLTRRPSLFTTPKASQLHHVRENAAALDFTLTPEDLAALDATR